MFRRPFAEMLSDVFDVMPTTRANSIGVRATEVSISTPIEVELIATGSELLFIADLPVWRWRTEFDQTPGRLQITWAEVAK